MDSVSESWKKYPLLVLGELPFPVPGARALEPATIATAGELSNFYIFVAYAAGKMASVLQEIEDRGVAPEQILVYWRGGISFAHPLLPRLGLLDELPGESAEEFRLRVSARLEAQRQKRLAFMLRSAAESGLASRLSETELQRALESACIAHALCCRFGLGPAQHARALAYCLEGRGEPTSPWNTETPPDRLLAEAAAFALHCLTTGRNLREAIRERAAALSFRARTDLAQEIESCLGPALGGKHVA